MDGVFHTVEDAMAALDRLQTGSTLPPAAEVAGAKGWTPCRDLRPGDEVLTFHRGLCPVASVTSVTCGSEIVVPEGMLGNLRALTLGENDLVGFESHLCDIMHDSEFVLLPAAALVGFRGVVRRQVARGERLTLRFEVPDVVFSRDGAMLFCGTAEEAAALEDRRALTEDHIAPLTFDGARRLLALADAVEAEAVRFTAPI